MRGEAANAPVAPAPFAIALLLAMPPPCSFPSSSGEQQSAKRRRVEGGGSGSEEEEEQQEEEEECTGVQLLLLSVALISQGLAPLLTSSFAPRCPSTVANPYTMHPSPLPPDAAWVRYSAVCGLLRLARAYDSHMPAALYANLALTLQVGRVEAC